MKSIFLVGLTLFSTSLSAETALPSQKSELQTLLADLTNFSANFTQTIYDEGEAIDQSSGTLTLMRPNKMRWETRLPEENLIIADGNSIWNIDSFVEQVTVFSQDDTVKNNPIMLLTSNEKASWDKFSVLQLGAINDDKSLFNRAFEVSALDDNAQITKLTLRFKDRQLVSLETTDSQGQRSNMDFESIQSNQDLPVSVFSVVYPEHYAVDDQR